MLVYNYDPITREYTGSEQAKIDPLETVHAGTSIFLLPANATFTAPPEPKEGYVYCWISNKWEKVESHIGELAYLKTNASATTITDIGPIPADRTLLPPPAGIEFIKWDGNKWVEDTAAKADHEVKELKKQKEIVKGAARRALSISGNVALCCFKVGIAYPALWLERDVILTQIVNGKTSITEIPLEPEYPVEIKELL